MDINLLENLQNISMTYFIHCNQAVAHTVQHQLNKDIS